VKRASAPWRLSIPLASALACCTVDAAAQADAASRSGVIADADDWTTGISLYLDVTMNGVATARIAHFDDRGGELFVRASTLRELGFVLPPDTGDPLRLAGLAGVAVDYDAVHQRVAITAPFGLLDVKTKQLNAAEPAPLQATSSPGMLLDYDLYATAGSGNGSLAASTELRAFAGGTGVFDSTQIARHYQIPGGGWHDDSARLDTSWQFPFPDSMLRLTIGDALTGALDWTRATRIGGISFGTDFALQPYRVTTPLPAFFGAATLPSTVDLYIDGIRQFSGHVDPGPFQLNAIPTINGIGSAQIVMTDALGRSSTLNLPLYATHQLLQAGLADWSVHLGMVRENYGLSSFDYASDPMGSASLRYGVSDRFTVEAHSEGSNGLVNAGAGGVLLLGTSGGVLSGSYARSSGDGDGGSQIGLGYSWTNNRFNFSADSLRTRGDYRDVAARYGLAPAHVSDRAVASFATRSGGSFGVNLLRQQYPQQAAARYAGAFWSNTWSGRLSLNVGVNQNLDDARDRSVFASVTFTPDNRRTYAASLQRTRGETSATVQASEPIPGDGGFGWRAVAQGGGASNGGAAEAGWLGNQGQLTAGVNALGDSRYGYADANGALVLMGGHVFAARHIDDAFAVVSTDGVAGVPVHLENRAIGDTDAGGLLLVTRLNAYQRNQLSIDPMSLPANVHVDRVDAAITPSDHAGVMVRFGMAPQRAASIVLLDAAGKPIALGSSVRVAGKTESAALVGFDGVVYLDNLDLHSVLTVQTPTGPCRTKVDYPPHAAGAIPELGPLSCRSETP
jgi:outer membrane usher protein